MDIYAQINELRKQAPAFDDDLIPWLDSAEKQLKQHSLIKNLGEHDGMKIIMKGFKTELSNVEDVLMNSEELFKTDSGMILGQVLHDRRKYLKKFLNIFTNADKGIDAISKAVNIKSDGN